MPEIVCGVVQPDYGSCCDGPVAGLPPVVVVGPPGPPGPTGPEGPPGTPEDMCPLFCGTGSPETVVTSPIGGPYEQTDAASTSHPLWLKMTGVGNTGWRSWAGLGSEGLQSYRLGDDSLASGEASLALAKGAQATALRSVSVGSSLANNRYMYNFGTGNTVTNDTVPSTADDGQLIWGHNNTYSGTNGLDARGDEQGPLFIIGNHNVVGQDGDLTFEGKIGIIGDWNEIYGAELYVFGRLCEALESPGGTLEASTYGLLLGPEVEGLGDCFIAAGYQAQFWGIGATAIGPHAVAGVDEDSLHTTSLGRFANAFGDRSVALGSSSDSDEEGIALGHGAQAEPNKLRIGSVSAPIDTIEVMTSAGLKTVTINP